MTGITGEQRQWLLTAPLPVLMTAAADLRDQGHGRIVSYSRKVFIPLTKLCRDVCHYCTFAKAPSKVERPYLLPEQVLDIARRGEQAGCTEALFTLGDKPELRYRAAREALDALGHGSTIGYLRAMCELVLKETGLLPHVNPGVMTGEEIAALREVSVSQGIMLESTSERLCQPGGVHYGSPDKHPTRRLETLELAGRLAVPFTTGILIGIGETRQERIDALLAIRDLHHRHGHIQEVIVQNFRAKADTRMAGAEEPDFDNLLWTVAVARILLGADSNLQAPPNLTPSGYERLIGAGINDWGGISPVTIDHVNPEAAWPQITALAERTAGAGKALVNRLPVYPSYALAPDKWLAPALAVRVRRCIDADGLARQDRWSPGTSTKPPVATPRLGSQDPKVQHAITRAMDGHRLDPPDIVRLFSARDASCELVLHSADSLRRQVSGDVVRYVVNRNINYTNICYFRCAFCAFSKGKKHAALRGEPYDLQLSEIIRRAHEAWQRGATEVCLQGGIHPDYTGATYLAIARAIREAQPGLHIHAFSPLEVAQGAATLGIPVGDFLLQLKEAGLGTLPGTAAEILDDEVRAELCPDKLKTGAWLDVMRAAHRAGLRSTATIMYGHMERPVHWARHLLAIRDLQEETGGFTEFVPLPFVHMEAPMYLRGRARKGPTYREAGLMHAVARLVLNPLIPNIQTSWVKMGQEGAAACLNAGANDLGGTLMNESISRAAGTEHGQELGPEAMQTLIGSIGRVAQQRTTLYGEVSDERRTASFNAPALAPLVTGANRKLAAVE
ncbi:MAG TPA: 5-amino-6-(D-ribitylamino)uracil--L-tyrosine 4-hydroxyphenyl transferase CofH [Hyphomicrobiaceae bacterium]|nr:5-amino-6-(D-ribitylamino)uracil--L-tyrosine 4-hydroxyphenyl transferase CofH [Hyphomicrobiaceae bacterium]